MKRLRHRIGLWLLRDARPVTIARGRTYAPETERPPTIAFTVTGSDLVRVIKQEQRRRDIINGGLS